MTAITRTPTFGSKPTLLNGGYPVEAYCELCDEFFSYQLKECVRLITAAIAQLSPWRVFRGAGPSPASRIRADQGSVHTAHPSRGRRVTPD